MTKTTVRPVATKATKLPQSTKPALSSIQRIVMLCMFNNNKPLSDRDLTLLTGRHNSSVRGAREALVKAGIAKHSGFKYHADSRKAHMTWSYVPPGRGRGQAVEVMLHKRIMDCVNKISCLKESVRTDRRALRALEAKAGKKQRELAAAAAS